ncbi:Aste57867_18782 [Aphanomyces stellatus]|uniref:Aste57867_18782 protein n=1 Tax=Aphanomyces stellatus TaxID=120398 RepID=A0A485LCH1_9STRA|nr:hypothetical protein As57867_018718 [Aphanomyces stellatus]VFT95516.1 Aste57867_18782 [Aphanomyces stellatus]
MSSNPFEDPAVKNASASPAASAQMLPIPPKQGSFNQAPSQHGGAAPVAPIAPTSIPVSPVGAPRSPKNVAENLMEEVGSSIKKTDSAKILKVMQGINIILAAFTVTAGVLAWVAGHVTDFQTFIASIYIIVFGLLLLGFELRTSALDTIMRANFGFMYGYKTRTMFLVFIAIWPLSMGTYWVTILNAVLLFLNAFFNYFVVSAHPAFSSATPPEYDAARISIPGTAPTSPAAATKVENQV